MDDAVDGCGDFDFVLFVGSFVFGEMGFDEFGCSGFEHFRHPVENLSAVVWRAFCPRWTGFCCGFDGVAHIFAGAEWDVCEELILGIVDGVGEVGFGADECAADVAFGGFGDGESWHGYVIAKRHDEGKALHAGCVVIARKVCRLHLRCLIITKCGSPF